MLERVGEVAYRLELPLMALLHPIFHVLLLKKKVGDLQLIVGDLPAYDEEGHMILKPKEVLQYRLERQEEGLVG